MKWFGLAGTACLGAALVLSAHWVAKPTLDERSVAYPQGQIALADHHSAKPDAGLQKPESPRTQLQSASGVRNGASQDSTSRPGWLGQPRYESEPDLFRFATRAADASDRATLVSGWYATQDCRVLVEDRELLRTRAAEAIGKPDPGTTADAAAKLLERCRGFMDSDPAAIRVLRARFTEKLTALDQEVYLTVTSARPITDSQFSRVIDSRDGLTFSAVISDVLPRMRARLGLDAQGAESLALAIALEESTCELGRVCSEDGLPHLIRCAIDRRCNEVIMSRPTDPSSPEVRDLVQRYKARILNAFRNRDVEFFRFARR